LASALIRRDVDQIGVANRGARQVEGLGRVCSTMAGPAADRRAAAARRLEDRIDVDRVGLWRPGAVAALARRDAGARAAGAAAAVAAAGLARAAGSTAALARGGIAVLAGRAAGRTRTAAAVVATDAARAVGGAYA